MHMNMYIELCVVITRVMVMYVYGHSGGGGGHSDDVLLRYCWALAYQSGSSIREIAKFFNS